jgi:eukaryotic-like serine/threonine-protein kinase
MNDTFDDDPRVLEIAREYMAELEAGHRPDRRSYTRRHPELAAAVSECLEAIDMAQALRPPADMAADPLKESAADEELTAQPLGDFRIVREIGRGGMGIVYEATQLSLGRKVALKVLPFAASLDAKQLQRFKTESQAAAQLHHTNIVPIFAVGADRGVHYYAMQLIEGRTLDTVIAELRGNPDASMMGQTVDFRAGSTAKTNHSQQTKETFRKSARIAAQVADALDYAHDAGVIHRDIKPANLILDDRGTIWVADFGLAHISSDVRVTQTGDIFGTLRYMSPEQAQGRKTLIDHRADLYSLGATLYEMLALKPIFNGDDRVTLLRQILNEDPRPLRQHDRTIPVELETIVMKSVAKSPGERYASAGEMADDLRRFLDERPILAKPPTVIDRARKWARRHPSYVAATLLFLLFSLIGMGIGAARISREQQRTEQALSNEKVRAKQAEDRFLLAKRSVDEMVQVSEEELVGPQYESARRRLLESALVYYQEFIDQRRDDPLAQAELAANRDRVQQILADLATLQGAGQLFLAFDPSVHDELKATGAQRTELHAFQEQISKDLYEVMSEVSRSGQTRQQRMVEVLRTQEASLVAILTPDQQKRLKQVTLQSRGPTAFRDPDVIAALQLSTEQRERLRLMELDSYTPKMDWGKRGFPFGDGPPPHQPMHGGPKEFFGMKDGPEPKENRGPKEGFGGPKDGPRDGPKEGQRDGPFRRPMEMQHRVVVERMLAVLTPEQRTKWKDLTGEPFVRSFNPRNPKSGPRP